MRVHATAVVVEQRLGHERGSFIVAARHLFDECTCTTGAYRPFSPGVETHIDFRLPGRGHFDGDAFRPGYPLLP